MARRKRRKLSTTPTEIPAMLRGANCNLSGNELHCLNLVPSPRRGNGKNYGHKRRKHSKKPTGTKEGRASHGAASHGQKKQASPGVMLLVFLFYPLKALLSLMIFTKEERGRTGSEAPRSNQGCIDEKIQTAIPWYVCVFAVCMLPSWL